MLAARLLIPVCAAVCSWGAVWGEPSPDAREAREDEALEAEPSAADREKVAAAEEALAVAVFAREEGDLEPAREYLDIAVDALGTIGAASAEEVTGIKLAVAREALTVAIGAREEGDLGLARRYVAKALDALHGLEESAATPTLAVVQWLDDVAATLEMHGTQLVTREWIVRARERLLPPEHYELLTARLELARTRSLLGDPEGARPLEEAVHEAWERLLPADHPSLLSAKQNLSVTRYRLGDLEGARVLQEHVLAAREKALHPDDPDVFGAMLNLALTLRLLGDHEGARVLEEHVHAARERLLPSDHLELLNIKSNLALTRKQLGDLDGARELTRALLAGQLARATALRAESPRVARSAALRELRRLPKAFLVSELTATDAAASLEPALFSVLESLRRVSTSSSEVALATSRHPELQELRARLHAARGELTDLGLAPPLDATRGNATQGDATRGDASGVDGWRGALVELAEKRDVLERELRTRLAERGVFSGTITSEGVGRALDAGSAAVTFFRYPRERAADPETGAASLPVDSLLAFVVRPDGSATRVELGPSAGIDELAVRWRALLGKPVERGLSLDSMESTEAAEEEVGRALRERILDPCLAETGAGSGDGLPERLHVVLDDFLHLVPVDALPWKDGRRLGEVLELRLEVSLQRLVAPQPELGGEGGLVALGGVSFGAKGVEAPRLRIATQAPPVAAKPDEGASPDRDASPDRGSAPESFASLLQSRYEVEALSDQYRELVGGEPTVLLKEEATKKALVELAPGARYLHLATHGWFAPETFRSMRDGAEAESDDLSSSLSRAEESVRGFAPETLCGLALAGANRGRNADGKVPGILTAEELATLELSRCELAVLSACETNVGIRRAGQGIQSLQGALHAAGARTAITSLWKVDDAATRRLMELFYAKLWEDGLGKAEALWRAKMEMRDEGHPLREWGGWVLTGDPD